MFKDKEALRLLTMEIRPRQDRLVTGAMDKATYVLPSFASVDCRNFYMNRYLKLRSSPLHSCLCQAEGETYVAVTFLLMPTCMTVALISLLHFCLCQAKCETHEAKCETYVAVVVLLLLYDRKLSI